MRRMFFRGMLAAIIVTSLAAGSLWAQESYVVGVSIALTGPGSDTYAPIKDALDVYFKEVNGKGGINGHQVKLIYEDNQAQPSKAAAHAKKFISQDKALMIINVSLSSTYPPMVQAAKEANVPIFFAGAVCPPEVYPPTPDSLQFCSTSFAAKFDSRYALQFLTDQTKPPFKLGLAAMNIPLSRGEIDFAEELAKTMNIKVVEKVITPPVTPDYTPFASKLKDADPDWVYAWAPWAMEVRTLEALRKLGWKGKYLTWGHLEAEDDLARLKDDNLYVFATNSFYAENQDIHKKIREAATAAKTVYPYTKLSEGWIAAMVLEDALKKTSWPPTPEKVRAAMNQVKVDTKGLKGGPLTWAPNNHFRTVNYYRTYRWDTKKNGIVVVKDWIPIEIK
jgi:branched-chain amino acid transport system substrate-binding protein